MRRWYLAFAVLAACSSHAPQPAPIAPPTPEPTRADIAPPTPAEREAPPPTLRLPTSFRPNAYHARLALDPAKPRFDGDITIDATLAAASPIVWLHAQNLTIDRAEAIAGGQTTPLDAKMHGDHFLALRAASPLPAGAVQLHLVYHGETSDQQRSGAWRRQWDGTWYVFTQFESISARRVFPCVDEPSSKVPWQLTLDVPAGDVALSNTTAKTSALDAGGQRFEFAPTRPLPSYLVAFAVGPFELVDGGTTPSGKPIRIAAPAHHGADAAFAAKVTGGVVGALERYFGTPYPYDKLDEVATAGGGGAMENAGMITYGERLILIDPNDPSRSRRVSYESVAAHEIAHHWFGDLVTTAWWDDIWLNEAFASWMSDKVLAEIDPSAHAELGSVGTLGRALAADDLGSARMIRQPIAAEDDIYNAFDGITYQKGASVIRMFERWVGPAKFQAGVRDYLAAHADKNATADDFLAAIGAAAGVDVATPFKTFLDQAGAPRITATVTCTPGAPASIALHQERYLPKGATAAGAPVWQVPVCVVYGDDRGGRPSRECTLLATADGALEPKDSPCPSWLYANADAAGYYRVGLTAAQLDAVVKKGWRELDTAEQLEVAGDVEAMVAHGDVGADVALGLVPKLLAEKSPDATEKAAAIATSEERYVPAAQHAGYQAWIRKTFGPLAAKLGWLGKKGESDDVERERRAVVPLVAVVGGDPALRHEAVKLAATWRKLPSSIAWPVIAAAVDDGKTFDALFAQVKDVAGDRGAQADLLRGLAHVHDPARQAKVFALSLDPSFEWSQVFGLAGETGNDQASVSAGAAFFRDHAADLLARMPPMVRGGFAGAVTSDCDPATRDAAVKAAESSRAYPGGPRRIAQATEELDQCIAQKALRAPALAHVFGGK